MNEKLILPDRVVLTRHCQSIHNAALWHSENEVVMDQFNKIVQESDDPEKHYTLSEVGINQAIRTGEALWEDPNTMEVLRHGGLYYSELFRTAQSAYYYCGGDLSGWQETELLNERDYGPFGVSIYTDDTEEKKQLWQDYKDDYWGTNFGGRGESILEISQRNKRFADKIKNDGASLASTHGDWIRGFRHLVEGVDLSKLTPDTEDVPIWNGMILEYEKVGDKLYRRFRYPNVNTNGKTPPDNTGEWMRVR